MFLVIFGAEVDDRTDTVAQGNDAAIVDGCVAIVISCLL